MIEGEEDLYQTGKRTDHEHQLSKKTGRRTGFRNPPGKPVHKEKTEKGSEEEGKGQGAYALRLKPGHRTAARLAEGRPSKTCRRTSAKERGKRSNWSSSK